MCQPVLVLPHLTQFLESPLRNFFLVSYISLLFGYIPGIVNHSHATKINVHIFSCRSRKDVYIVRSKKQQTSPKMLRGDTILTKEGSFSISFCSIKKYQRNSTVQEEGLTNEARHHFLLLCKQAHDKRNIAELLHPYLNRARLTTCEVGLFLKEISQPSKIRPPPSLRSSLPPMPWATMILVIVPIL